MNLHLKKVSAEVYYAKNEIPQISNKNLKILKEIGSQNRSKKARICTHRSLKDLLHGMFIFHENNCHVPVHKHLNRSEIVIILEGQCKLNIFDNRGRFKKKIVLGSLNSGLPYSCHIPKNVFHNMEILSKNITFFEATTGPFNKKGTQYLNRKKAELSIPINEKLSNL